MGAGTPNSSLCRNGWTCMGGVDGTAVWLKAGIWQEPTDAPQVLSQAAVT